MNKFLVLVSIVALAMLWPFSCTPQSKPDCDPIYVEDPALQEEIRNLNQMIQDLTAENVAIREDMDALNLQVASLQKTISERDTRILELTQENTNLRVQLAECTSKPADTVYVDVPVEVPVMPKPTISEVVVSHSNPDVGNRRFFHRGGIDIPYPKWILFETTDACLIECLFETELTQEIREAASLRLEKTIDHENGRTTYKFIRIEQP